MAERAVELTNDGFGAGYVISNHILSAREIE